MSLLSNPNPTRLGIYQSWFSNWYENNPVYSSLIYTDLYVNEFLNGIYYKLKMPSTLPMIRDLGYQTTMIYIKSFMQLKKLRNRKFLSFYSCNKVIKVRHRRLLMLFRRTLIRLKKFNSYCFLDANKCVLSNNSFLLNTNLNPLIRNSIIQTSTIYKTYTNKKSPNIAEYNKKKTLKYLNELFYKMYNKRKYKAKQRNVIKYIKKQLIVSKKKNIKLLKQTFSNNHNQIKIYERNNKRSVDKIKKKLNIVASKRRKVENKYNVLLHLYNQHKYKHRRKVQLYTYKFKIVKFRKYRLNKIRRKKSRKRIKKRKKFFSLFGKNKKKIYNRFERIRFSKFNNNNQLILLFKWLLYKLETWFKCMLLQSLVIFNILIGNNSNNFKKPIFIIGGINLFSEENKQQIYSRFKKKFINIFYTDQFISKNYLPLGELINNKNYLFTGSFSKERKLTNMHFIKNVFNYNRIKSYYRLERKRIRDKKRKEYEFKYAPRIFVLHFRLLSGTKKWIKSYFHSIFNRQLNLKINSTLSTYLSKSIFFINQYNRTKFSRLDDPKLLSDYIKLLMKYEFKNPTILKKIVKIHSHQRIKCRKRTYFLMHKLSNLKKRIHNKFTRFLNIFQSRILSKKLYFKKSKENVIFTTKKENKFIKKKYELKFKEIIKKKMNKKEISFSQLLGKSQREKNKYNLSLSLNKFKNRRLIEKNNRHHRFNKNNHKQKMMNDITNVPISFIKIRNKIKSNYNISNIKNNSFFKNINQLTYAKQYCINTLNDWKFKFRDLSYKRYPLIGMRIEFNGPTKKGRRTQTHLYNEWVDFYRLPGKMPLVTIMSDVRYWQTYGLTQRAAIGIKLWMYFHSPFYSQISKKLLNKE